MFPLRDHNPSSSTPYVVYFLMAANILGYFWYTTTFTSPHDLGTFYAAYAAVPTEIMAGDDTVTLLTSIFVHGGFMHLAGNMLFLWIFGDNMEDEMGHIPFLIFYLISGVCATLAHVLSDPTSQVPLVGASGAIAGVMGGYLLMFPKARIDIFIFFVVFFKIIPIPAFLMLGIWLGLQFIGGFGGDGAGVAYWAHTGGFLIGLLMTLPLWLRRGGPAFWQQTQGHPPHPEIEYKYSQSRIPRVPRRPRVKGSRNHSGPWSR